MPPIRLTDNSNLNIIATDASPNYLKSALEFLFQNLSQPFKQAQDKTIGDLDSGAFPLALSAAVPGSFAPTASLHAGARCMEPETRVVPMWVSNCM
jgi:hypothetical protein